MEWTTETMRKPRKRGEEIDVLVCDSRDDEGRSLKYSAGRAASVWVAIRDISSKYHPPFSGGPYFLDASLRPRLVLG